MKRKILIWTNKGLVEKDQEENIIEIKYIDATPDGNYALRILKCYLANCDYRITDNLDGNPSKNKMFVEMNKLQEIRAEELQKAIDILERERL